MPSMWQRFTKPDLLVYLDVSQGVASERRRSEAEAAWWDALNRRLEHALEHADLYVDTDDLTPPQVLNRVVSFLQERGAQS